jgi:hypothetical protein
MENVKLNRPSVVDETATFIAAELKALLDRRNPDSFMTERLVAACPAWEKLRIGEHVLATLKALNLVTLDVIADMATLTHDTIDDDEDDPADIAAFHAHLEEGMRKEGLPESHIETFRARMAQPG